MGAHLHFRGGPLAVARRVDGRSWPGSRQTCEEAEEEPERRRALNQGCGEDGIEKIKKVVELLSLTGWVSGVSGVTHMISFDSPNDPIKGLLFPFHR